MTPEQAKPARELLETLLQNASPGETETSHKIFPEMMLSFSDPTGSDDDFLYSLSFYPERHVVSIRGYQEIRLSSDLQSRFLRLMDDIKANYARAHAPQVP